MEEIYNIMQEPEPKRQRLKEKLNSTLEEPMDPNVLPEPTLQEIFDKLRTNGRTSKTEHVEEKDDYETLHMKYETLKKEYQKQEQTIRDLTDKLYSTMGLVRAQAEQIKELQAKLMPAEVLPLPEKQTIEMKPLPISPDIKVFNQSTPIELRIIQQPPGQAVYQRILRPFPTVAIIGINPKSYANYFVEAQLLKKSNFDNNSDYQYVTWFKQTTNSKDSPTNDKERSLMGGQIVQRSEPGPTPNSVVVVFRKLKILTTSAQQGAFFVLKFSLKRYQDNVFEPVPQCSTVISDPIEVFSHTLYLKGKPNSRSSSSSAEDGQKSNDAIAALHAATLEAVPAEQHVAAEEHDAAVLLTAHLNRMKAEQVASNIPPTTTTTTTSISQQTIDFTTGAVSSNNG